MTALIDQPTTPYNPNHGHGLNTTVGYRIVQTITPDNDRTKRITMAAIDGDTNYAKALGVLHELRQHARRTGSKAWFVVEDIYVCGCREYPEIP